VTGVDSPRWPRARPIESSHLRLEPLRVEHADVLAVLLDDPALHTFTGGLPASAADLRDRFRRQVVGHSPDGREGWLNWVVRVAESDEPVGTVQATLTLDDEEAVAELAWVTAGPHQRQGYATEAAAALVGWLTEQGVTGLVAHVHPEHLASASVARTLGLHPTDRRVDGEVRWES
jgi:RimJ/RimL family protein N-acetyltransferase